MKIRCLFAVAGLVILAWGSQSGAYVLSDNFDDNSWNDQLWYATTYGEKTILQESNNRLEIIFPEDGLDEYAIAGLYESRFILRGDFDMQIDYTLFNGSLFDNGGVWSGASSSGIVSRYNISGMGDWYGSGPTPVPTNDISGKLRLVRTGSICTGYYFENGIWVALDSVFQGAYDTVIEFGYSNDEAKHISTPLSIALDNFVINEGQVVYNIVPEPSSFAALGIAFVGMAAGLVRRRRG